MSKTSLRSLLALRLGRSPEMEKVEQSCCNRRPVHSRIKWCLPLSHASIVQCVITDKSVITSDLLFCADQTNCAHDYLSLHIFPAEIEQL